MSPMEAYSFLFADIFMSVLLLPFQGEVALTAMKMFGGYNTMLILALSVTAGFLASIVNFVLGELLVSIVKAESKKDGSFAKITGFIRKKGVFLLLFAAYPYFGAAVTVLMGVCGVRYKYLIPLVFVGSVTYYLALFFI